MAVADYFLKIDGIKGESQDSKHAGEIEIHAFSFGSSQSGSFSTGGGGGAGKVQMQDFHFTMPLQQASPKLLFACAAGDHITTATLTCRKAGGKQEPYLKVNFTTLIISSFSSSGSSDGDSLPVDQVSFNFEKIEYVYREQGPLGNLIGTTSAAFDIKKMLSSQ